MWSSFLSIFIIMVDCYVLSGCLTYTLQLCNITCKGEWFFSPQTEIASKYALGDMHMHYGVLKYKIQLVLLLKEFPLA